MEDSLNQKKSQEHVVSKKQLLQEERENLQLLLIQGAENLINDKFSDKFLDKQNEKIKLISGVEISLKRAREILTFIAQNHPSQFDLDFYISVFRIMNLEGDPSHYFKDRKVADFTNEVIYGRFDKEILPTLQRMNNYVGYCIRAKHHYQFLNDEGILKLQEYIQEAKDVMNSSTSYYEFRVKMYNLYNVPYQIQMTF
jgi:hypothetical protein